MLRYFLILSVFTLLFIFPRSVSAQSPYVLPYPSVMPGSIFYKLSLIHDKILKFWHFGDFGRFRYNLSQSDKYLVEAKILFDYKQYLLASQALQKSDNYFRKIEPALLSAKKNRKNTEDKEKLLREAAAKHIEELSKLRQSLPATFEWRPEKQQAVNLKLHEAIDASVKIRQEILY
jgi:hypothetical protein